MNHHADPGVHDGAIPANLPIRSPQHIIGDQAVALVVPALPPAWVVRPQSGDNGIDLEIKQRLGNNHHPGNP